MGFFTRVSDILSANINDLLDRMEDPEKMMKQLIREMEDAVQEAKNVLLKTIAHERLAEKEIAAHRKKIDEWQARAVEAVKQDRDDLARRALELKKESEAILAALEPELKAAAEGSAAMRTQLRAIRAKCQEAKRKQTTLSARKRAAEVQKKAAGAPAKTGAGTGAFAEFDRIEEKVAQIEAEAEAATEVNSAEKAVEDDFGEWEAGVEIDAELAALKKKVQKASG